MQKNSRYTAMNILEPWVQHKLESTVPPLIYKNEKKNRAQSREP